MKTDHDIFDDDTFQPRDREEKKKIEFFWEDCLPEEEEDVVASIRAKALRKIQEEGKQQVLPSAKKKRTNRFYIAVASVAATIAVLLSIPYISDDLSQKEDFRQVIALMDMLPVEETDDVVLVMSDQEKLQLASDAKIA